MDRLEQESNNRPLDHSSSGGGDQLSVSSLGARSGVAWTRGLSRHQVSDLANKAFNQTFCHVPCFQGRLHRSHYNASGNRLLLTLEFSSNSVLARVEAFSVGLSRGPDISVMGSKSIVRLLRRAIVAVPWNGPRLPNSPQEKWTSKKKNQTIGQAAANLPFSQVPTTLDLSPPRAVDISVATWLQRWTRFRGEHLARTERYQAVLTIRKKKRNASP